MESSDIVITPNLGGWSDRRSPIPIRISDFTPINEIEIVPEYDPIEPIELVTPESEDRNNKDVLAEILKTVSEIKDILDERLSDNTREGARGRPGVVRTHKTRRDDFPDRYRNRRLGYSA